MCPSLKGQRNFLQQEHEASINLVNTKDMSVMMRIEDYAHSRNSSGCLCETVKYLCDVLRYINLTIVPLGFERKTSHTAPIRLSGTVVQQTYLEGHDPLSNAVQRSDQLPWKLIYDTRFHRSTPLVSRSNRSDRRSESESGTFDATTGQCVVSDRTLKVEPLMSPPDSVLCLTGL